MRLIAVEEHFLTRELRDAWAVAPGPVDPTCAFHDGVLGARLEDLGDTRLSLMDETGVDVQVLSLTTPGLHNLESGASTALARRTNDLVAEAVERTPERFQGFAALPTPAPREAPRELERAVRELGLKGAMLCGRTKEKNLDHPDFWPIFDYAAGLGVPLFIHPQIPRPAMCDACYSGFGAEVDLALAGPGLGRPWAWMALRSRAPVRSPSARGRLRPVSGPADHPGPLGRGDPVLPRTIVGARPRGPARQTIRHLRARKPLCDRERDVQRDLFAAVRRDRRDRSHPVLDRLPLSVSSRTRRPAIS
jgi:Amidohydrolase